METSYKNNGNTISTSHIQLLEINDGRCHNPRTSYYESYGGRGIFVCDEWRYNFDAFVDWAISVGYRMDGEDRYIDRIDNDKGYSPDNCRFVDNSTNQTNKRVYGKVKYRGVSVLASYLKSPHRICKTFGTVEEAVIFWDSVCWHYERDPDRLNFPDRIEEYNKFDITSI